MEQKLTDVCNQLEPFLDIIYDNANLFLDTFAPDANDLIQVHFSLTHFKFVVVLFGGQHIVDEKPLIKLEKWLNTIEN